VARLITVAPHLLMSVCWSSLLSLKYLFIYLFLDPSYAYVYLLCVSFQSSDQLPLSRSSSQEVEQQHLDDPQPVAALPAPVVSPATVVPPSVPVEVPVSVPPPVQVPVPVSAPVVTSQPMEQDSVASSSSAGGHQVLHKLHMRLSSQWLCTQHPH